MGVQRDLVILLVGMCTTVFIGSGCSGGSYLDSVDAGRTIHYAPGALNFDLEVVATARDGLAGIDLYLSIPHVSLVFLPVDEGYQARFETMVRLLDRRGKTLVADYVSTDTVSVPTYEEAQSFVPYHKAQRLAVRPGTYLVEVVVMDAESREEASRRQRIKVVAVGAPQPVLSRVRLEGKTANAAFSPILSLHLPTGLDSLKAIVELYNADHLGEGLVTMHVLRFPSDTLAARPPFAFRGGEEFGLIRYHRPDTLQETRRRVRDLSETFFVEFDLPQLDEGIYRVEVTVAMLVEATGDPVPFRSERRDFAVRGITFPQIATLDEMVDALVYIARKEELNHIQRAETAEEKRHRFDAFWGTLMPEPVRAANLLKLYYNRVEEANLRYSSYKEGWKTDRGMIFILFGPPLYVDTQLEHETWRYSYDEYDRISALVFTRRRIYASGGLFEAFLLQRDYGYEAGWRRAVRQWRRGEVL